MDEATPASKKPVDDLIKPTRRHLMFQGLDLFKIYYAHSSTSSKVYIMDKDKSRILCELNEFRGIFPQMKRLIILAIKAEGLSDLMRQKSFQVTEDFHPDKPLLFGDRQNLRLNLYDLPAYRKSASKKSVDISLFHAFMEKLIPCEISRRATLLWIWQSLGRKAMTHLLLVGAKGSGKTFLASTILSALHGSTNHFVESIRQSRSGFDSCDYNKTAIFIDECSFATEEKKSNVKFRLNEFASFNVKYQPLGGSQQVFASLIYACNSAESILVEVDDRCFTIPDITDRPATFDPEYKSIISKLSKILDPQNQGRDNFLRSVYNYLQLEFIEDASSDKEILIYSKNFERLVKQADAPHRRAIYAVARTNKTFIADDVNELIKRRRIQTSVEVTKEALIYTNDLYKERFGSDLYVYDEEHMAFISHSHEVTL